MRMVGDWHERYTGAVRQAGELRPLSRTAEDLRRQYIFGSVEECRDRVHQYVDAGMQQMMIYFLDYPSTDSLERFAQEIMPKFR
jgi:alkanesulfonate monooxygenase SsuD/methylene tetrahydromethanopterin reductase-like flavin-dependent oxidoreductase (luciferase family)